MVTPPQTLPPTKRYRLGQLQTPPRDWSDGLPTELLQIILSKLTLFDIPIFKSVCSSWRQAAAAAHPFRYSPLLMLPSLPPLFKPHHDHRKTTVGNHNESSSVFFYNLKDKSFYEYKNMPDIFHESRCIGSSNGFLVLLDKNADPYLLNLFTRRIIILPPKEKFPHIQDVYRQINDGDDRIILAWKYNHKFSMSFDDFRKWGLIQKAILSDNNNFVIIIYGPSSHLGYCRQSDSKWTQLNSLNYKSYVDILWFKNKLYALRDDGSIEVWDLNGSSPVKEIDIRPTTSEAGSYVSRELYSTHSYLVESGGDILLVVRYVGEFVKDGEPINECDLLTEEDSQPLVCPYQTLRFMVYKVDFQLGMMSRMECLGDRALFLGGNHGVSLSVEECRENWIYYTDNYWERMDEDYLYGGHDMGAYSMLDGSVHQFFEIHEFKIQPPPFWVFPP